MGIGIVVVRTHLVGGDDGNGDAAFRLEAVQINSANMYAENTTQVSLRLASFSPTLQIFSTTTQTPRYSHITNNNTGIQFRCR